MVLPGGKTIEYLLDAEQRRIGKRVNGALVSTWVYQNQTQIAAELDAAGRIVKRFVYAEKVNVPSYVVTGGTTYRIISNHVGTPLLLVDVASGEVVEDVDFDEFGVPLNAGTQAGAAAGSKIAPFGFAGGLYDRDTRLVHFGAREYDPDVGRWLSKDPICLRVGIRTCMGTFLGIP